MELDAQSHTSRRSKPATPRSACTLPVCHVGCPWFQEEVRQELEKRFGTEQVHEAA